MARYAIAVLLALGPLLRAAPQDEVVIRTTTSLVEVRVVAQDKDKNPVANLGKSDFEILDNGEPQPIRLFSAYRGKNPPPLKDGASAPAEGLPTPAEYALFVLDWMNSRYADRVRAQEELLKLLEDYEPRQRLAIYVLSPVKSALLCDFTYDRNLLSFLVKGMSLDPEIQDGPIGDGPLGGPGGPGRSGRMVSTPAIEELVSRASHQLTDTTVAFEMLSEHLAKIPGRKTLIWVSKGVPLVVGGSYFSPYVEPAIHKLNISDTAVYTLGEASNSLKEFARRTGGASGVSMRDALEDLDVSYTLGFHLPAGAKPGLHEIKVRVAVPHLTLRYRESYDPNPVIR